MARHDDNDDGRIITADRTMREMKKGSSIIRILLLLLPLVTIGYALIIIISDNHLTTNNMTQKLWKKSNSSILNTSIITKIPVDNPDALDDNDNSVIKQQQIENYRQGKALLLNVHATHHAGTTFCKTIGRNGRNHTLAPAFACIGDRDHVMPLNTYSDLYGGPHKHPWTHNKTNQNIQAIRPYFSMISWEYDGKSGARHDPLLEETDWEHPQLVSVIITRNPLSRLLAGDGKINKMYPGYNEGTLSHEEWWNYALDESMPNTNNFLLRIVGGDYWTKTNWTKNNNRELGKKKKEKEKEEKKKKKKEKEKDERQTIEKEKATKLLPLYLTQTQYDHAVEVLHRFTIVLDIECLNEGMVAVAKLLQLNETTIGNEITRAATVAHTKSERYNLKHYNKTVVTNRERIGYADVYDYLMEKNKWDLLFYEYSKTISLVRCDDQIV